jgi:hypothetical protein
MRALLFALLATVALPSYAELIQIAWDTQGRFERQAHIAPKGFVELCGRLRPKDSVRWQFEAEAPMSFNIHFHEGKAVRYPVKEEGAAKSQGVLEVKSEQDYCWMWSNPSDRQATLSVRLDR